MTAIDAPEIVQDERRAHAPALPEGVLEHHLDEHAQKRLAVQNLSKISFMVAPDGNRAISTEELKSDTHRDIIEQSLKTLLGERIDNAPYLAQPESGVLGMGSSSNFVELNAPANIKALAEAGVKDFVKSLTVEHHSHAARLKAVSGEHIPAKAA